MDEIHLLLKLIISGLLGALIGLERERRIQEEKKQNFAGFRTFILITILGTIISYISDLTTIYLLPVISIGVIFLVLGAYVITSYFTKEIGFTSELSFLISFFLGVMVFYGSEKIAVAFAILMTLVLTLRDYLHGFAGKLQKDELLEALKFAIISLVVPHFLPNKTVDPLGVINPFQIWFFIVLISSVDFLSYILAKVYGGKECAELTGILGGLISSTAMASTMAEKSKRSGNDSVLAFVTMISTSIMFLRVLLVIFLINDSLLGALLIPVLLMFTAGILGSYFIINKKSRDFQEVELKTPLKMGTIIKFAAFFVSVLVITRILLIYFGEIGIYISGFLTGLVDIDLVVLTVSSIAKNLVSIEIAKKTIIIGLISNTIVKFIISYLFGDKNFSMKVGVVVLLILIAGLAGIFLL